VPQREQACCTAPYPRSCDRGVERAPAAIELGMSGKAIAMISSVSSADITARREVLVTCGPESEVERDHLRRERWQTVDAVARMPTRALGRWTVHYLNEMDLACLEGGGTCSKLRHEPECDRIEMRLPAPGEAIPPGRLRVRHIAVESCEPHVPVRQISDEPLGPDADEGDLVGRLGRLRGGRQRSARAGSKGCRARWTAAASA
jgi:hypothetical protein